jgi:hypothetical protein
MATKKEQYDITYPKMVDGQKQGHVIIGRVWKNSDGTLTGYLECVPSPPFWNGEVALLPSGGQSQNKDSE